jgi:hypothetical protein
MEAELSEKLVRRVVLASLGERGKDSLFRIDAPEASEKEISLAIMEAKERGLVEACDVTNMRSDYPEWRLLGPTGASAKFIREARFSKKICSGVVAFSKWFIPILITAGFLKWLIRFLISLFKK